MAAHGKSGEVMSYMCFWWWQDACSLDSLVSRSFPRKIKLLSQETCYIYRPSTKQPCFIWNSQEQLGGTQGLAMTTLRVTTLYR